MLYLETKLQPVFPVRGNFCRTPINPNAHDGAVLKATSKRLAGAGVATSAACCGAAVIAS